MLNPTRAGSPPSRETLKDGDSNDGVLGRLAKLAAIVGAAATVAIAIAAYVRLARENRALSVDKIAIHDIARARERRLENEIDELRIRVLLYERSEGAQRERPSRLSYLHGRVTDARTKNALADVRIEVPGGSYVSSSSNGEFYIPCERGQTVQFTKEGFEPLPAEATCPSEDVLISLIAETTQ